MESLFPPTPPDSSPVMAGPGQTGQQRNTSSAATYRSSAAVGGVGRNGGGGRDGYYAAEDEVGEQEHVQRFRVRHGLSCVFGPVWPVGAGCYSQAALPMPLSKPLYKCLYRDRLKSVHQVW